MFLRFGKMFVLCALLLSLVAQVSAKGIWDSPDSVTYSVQQREIDPELVHDLEQFIDLIPKAQVDEVIAKYFLIDGDFRKALSFVQSRKFDEVLKTIKDVPEVMDLLEYLHMLESDESGGDFDYDIPQLEIVLLELMQNAPRRRQTRAVSTNSVNSFADFANELADHIPRGRLVDLVKEKCVKSKFSAFYTALRAEQFQTNVNAVLQCQHMVPATTLFKSHGISLQALVPVVERVLSWCPNV